MFCYSGLVFYLNRELNSIDGTNHASLDFCNRNSSLPVLVPLLHSSAPFPVPIHLLQESKIERTGFRNRSYRFAISNRACFSGYCKNMKNNTILKVLLQLVFLLFHNYSYSSGCIDPHYLFTIYWKNKSTST